jgi:hypothetical protein
LRPWLLARPPSPTTAAGRGKHGKGATKVFTLDPSTHGNPEGVATRGGGKVFFVGATGDGTIYRGTVGNPTVTEFIPGAAGKSAVGMKIRGGKLYVAGGMTGKIYVYSLARSWWRRRPTRRSAGRRPWPVRGTCTSW